MKKLKTYSLLCFLSLWMPLSSNGQERPIGANLTDVSPFGTTWYYTNALKQSTGWLISNANDTEDPINFSSDLRHELSSHFDENGYPLQVPFTVENNDQTNNKTLNVNCLVLNGQPAPYFYPSGDYLLIFEGVGRLAIQGDVDGSYIEFNTSGTHDVTVSKPSSLGLHLFILESDEANPITNVQLIFPEYATTYTSKKFQDQFIEIANNFDVLRFMKPLKSENNTIENWNDRTTESSFSYFLDVENTTLLGMPYEDVIQLSNVSDFDIWLCVPYRANDNYVIELASLIDRELNNDKKVYVEYSNETWNPAYPLTRAYMLSNGSSLATSNDETVAEFEAIHRFQTKRSLEIFQLFEDYLEDNNQIIKVIGTQSDPYTAELVFESFGLSTVNPNNQMPDAVAIAAYIGVTLFDDLRAQNINICDHSPEQLMDTLRNRVSKELKEMTSRYAELAEQNSISLFAYEGGQHITELNFQAMEPCAASLVTNLNRLPEMEDFFCELLDTWYETYNGSLFNVFNLAEGADDFGSFGLLESQWQPVESSPKWRGVLQCAINPMLSTLEINAKNRIEVYPNPSTGIIFLDNQIPKKYLIKNISGRIIEQGDFGQNQFTIDLRHLSKGIYLLETESLKSQKSIVRIILN